jgi:Flp pilus assembly protein TadG
MSPRSDTLLDCRRRLKKARTGSSAIELVILLPFLLVLVIGAAEFGRIYHASIVVAGAASAGARYGAQSVAISSDTAGMNRAASADAGDIGDISPASSRFCRCPNGSTPVSCTSPCVPPAGYPNYTDAEVFVQTTATKTVTFLMHYPGIPSTFTVQRTAIFRVQ